MAGPTDYRGFSLGIGARLPRARQRPRLWACIYRLAQGDGYPRPANHPRLTMAKRYCETADWHIAPGVLGSNCNLWRGAFASGPFCLCDILQSRTPTHGIAKRCAVGTSCSTSRQHCRYARSGRPTSSICADMIFGKDRTADFVQFSPATKTATETASQ